MIQIGLLGYGTVGQAVHQILVEQEDSLYELCGNSFKVKKILVRNIKKYQNKVDSSLLTTNLQDITHDQDIKLIIEVTGAVEPLLAEIKSAYLSGKHIITANKAFVSKYLEEIQTWKKDNSAQFLFEAAVAGALPIMSNVDKIATLNEIESIEGVMNGTSNIILTLMEKGASYDEALKEAQILGFAEADPSDDVQGIDTLRKLRILASLLYQTPILEEDIHLEGITHISQKELAEAQKSGCRIKLLAKAQKYNGKVEATVKPRLVPEDTIIGQLVGGENAIVVTTSNARELIFKGQGGGGRPTAFSILSDLIQIYS